MSLCWAKELNMFIHDHEKQLPTVLILVPPSINYLAIMMGNFAGGARTCLGRHDFSASNFK